MIASVPMPTAPDPNSFAEAFLHLWRGAGWQAMLALALVVLAWKWIDAWGKRGK